MNTRLDFLAQQVAVEMRKEGRRMSLQTIEEFFALVRPFYMALEPLPPAKAGATLVSPVNEIAPLETPSIESQLASQFSKLGL
jgi:hypothetical protein